MNTPHVIGIDYGSDSVRAVVVNALNGKEISSSVYLYEQWSRGEHCTPHENIFRQHPQDYIDGLKHVIQESLAQAPQGTAQQIVGISFDTTGSTPVAVDKEGTPLALKKEFTDNPNAMFILWKDHSSIKEADEINALAKSWGGEDYTKYSGGIYSSEWFWAKILRTLRVDEAVREAAFSWVEHCDWMPALITGNTNPLTMKRSRCSAGHKAMWHESWGGLPSEDFLTQLDPCLKGLRERLMSDTHTSDVCVGTITPDWAETLGLPHDVKIGVGAFDCHMGAVGAVVEPGVLTKVIGTSTCDIAIVEPEVLGERLIPGICGQVLGSVTPTHVGLEAGQSAFGDLYAWFKKFISWPMEQNMDLLEGLDTNQQKTFTAKLSNRLLTQISAEAAKIPVGQNKVCALDWVNGRRTPDANQHLKMAITGINMGTDVPAMFRALVEATACGSLAIMERMEQEGVNIHKVVAIGGIPKKSDFVMQICADLWQKEIDVVGSDQCCALGAAMFAATVAGVHPDIATAQKHMNSGIAKTYQPNAELASDYRSVYEQYLSLGQHVVTSTAVINTISNNTEKKN